MTKTSRLAACVFLLGAICSPVMAEEGDIDARMVGYTQKTVVETPSTATAWLLLAGLGLVCLGPLFLNAHRTHLD